MPKGIFLIKWDDVVGGTIYMKYPEDLKIPENAVQSIQISHNFTESHIITEEKNWNSVSFFNPEKEVVIVLVLEKYDEGNDYLIVLEEFNKELQKDLEEEKLKTQLERMFKFSQTVFRTRDEVFAKLSNELADLKMKVFFYERKFTKVIQSNQLNLRSRILYLLSFHDELNFEEICKFIKDYNSFYIRKVLNSLLKEDIIEQHYKRQNYYLKF